MKPFVVPRYSICVACMRRRKMTVCVMCVSGCLSPLNFRIHPPPPPPLRPPQHPSYSPANNTPGENKRNGFTHTTQCHTGTQKEPMGSLYIHLIIYLARYTVAAEKLDSQKDSHTKRPMGLPLYPSNYLLYLAVQSPPKNLTHKRNQWPPSISI